jgi:hypothetical protein
MGLFKNAAQNSVVLNHTKYRTIDTFAEINLHTPPESLSAWSLPGSIIDQSTYHLDYHVHTQFTAPPKYFDEAHTQARIRMNNFVYGPIIKDIRRLRECIWAGDKEGALAFADKIYEEAVFDEMKSCAEFKFNPN